MARNRTYPLEVLRVAEPIHPVPMNSPKEVVGFMASEALADREMFWVLHLNVKNRIVKKELVAMGAVDNCQISPGLALRSVVANGVPAVITVHNHPSGDVSPSVEDRTLWKAMGEACRLLGIRLVDNIVIGREGYFSEKQG